ncbi:MAG: YgjP-like metallopeptidase domain-containing protein [Sphingomonadales bacterium]
MRAIWNIISPTASSELVFSGGGRTRSLTVVRRSVARGMRLTVDPRDATVRLTLGTRSPLRPALAWAAGKRGWVEAELERLPFPLPLVPDMLFHLGDGDVLLDWASEKSRRVTLDGNVLHVGGPLDQLTPRVMRFLRAHALTILEAETRALAAAHGITIGRVGVGDTKSRWGSCAASGDIRYSWRLILAPAFVRRSTVAHEVAHRIHMNHGPAFHALAAKLYEGDPNPARNWLRANGPSLHWFGREG